MTENAAKDEIISEDLLSILVCPVDKSKVDLVDGELVCTKCGRHFKIENGIPNMLVEEGE